MSMTDSVVDRGGYGFSLTVGTPNKR